MKRTGIVLALALALAIPAYAGSTITVSSDGLAPGYHLCAVWKNDELLTFFDAQVGNDGKLRQTVDVEVELEKIGEIRVGISGANTGTPSKTATVVIAENDGSSDNTDSSSSSSSSSTSYNNKPKIKVNNPNGGTVQGFYYGVVVITPKSGYCVASVTVNGSEVPLPDDGRLTNLKASDEVVVTFESLTPQTSGNYTLPDQTSSGFVDVSPGTYYYDAAVWARDQGISKGEGGKRFNPSAICTRAEMVTFLWRANQSPEPTGSGKRFTDVPAGAYYEKAVQWAADEQIVKGVGKKKFNPTDTVTRAEAITFLYRANGSPAVNSSTTFNDIAYNAYYADAVQWAIYNKIAKGTGAKKFEPDTPCTRAQIVTFLYRDSEK